MVPMMAKGGSVVIVLVDVAEGQRAAKYAYFPDVAAIHSSSNDEGHEVPSVSVC